MERSKIPWLFMYRLGQVLGVMYLFIIMFCRTGILLNIVVWLGVCFGLPLVREKAKEQYPNKFKVYVRESRTLYSMLSNVLYLVILFAPSIARAISPNLIVFTTRCIWIICLILIVVIGYKDYKWRTMHTDTLRSSSKESKRKS